MCHPALARNEADGRDGILPYTSQGSERLVNQIDVLVDRSLPPGVRVVGQEGDAWPLIVIDSHGHLGYVMEMTRQLPPGVTGTAMSEVGALIRAM